MSEEPKPKISRLELLRAGALGVGGISLLSSLVGVGCAHERLVGDDGPPKTDPKLLKYREASTLKPGIHWLRGLCAFKQSIWIAGDMSIVEVGLDGTRKNSFEIGETAKCVACDPDGRLFAATDDKVFPLEQGECWPSLGTRARIVSLVATKEFVFVADAGNRRILRFDHSGKLLDQFGEKTPEYPGLIVPSPFIGLATHPSGDLLVTNIGLHRVERHAIKGGLIEAVGEAGMGMDGFCGCCNPTHVSVLPNGDMVTSEKGLPRVKVIRADGSLRCVVAGPEAFHAETVGLATTVIGDKVAVLDPWEGAVRIFAPA